MLQNRKISNNPTFGQVTKKTETRHVDAFTIGYIANEESTEGENIGSVFSLAIAATVTNEYSYFIPQLCEILEENKIEIGLIPY